MAGTILDKYRGILERSQDLSPVEPRIREEFEAGKRRQLLEGVDAQGRPFAPVKPSTMKTRGGTGEPLSPRGAASQVVSRMIVTAERIAGGLRIAVRWPMDWIRHHATGTRKMPRRDPTGFDDRTRRKGIEILGRWVYEGRR